MSQNAPGFYIHGFCVQPDPAESLGYLFRNNISVSTTESWQSECDANTMRNGAKLFGEFIYVACQKPEIDNKILFYKVIFEISCN